MKFHTVYDSFEFGPGGRDYIGKHSTDDPYDTYRGSFKDESFSPDDKIVFAYAKTKEGAVWLEIMFQRVFGVVEDPQYANVSYQTSVGFSYSRLGEKSEPEHCRKISEALKGRKLSEESIRKRQESRGEYASGEDHHMVRLGGHTEEACAKIKTARAKQEKVIGGCSHPWWVREDGTRTRALECPGEGWQRGMNWDARGQRDGKNRRWVSKEGEQRRSPVWPGKGWQNGTKWKD